MIGSTIDQFKVLKSLGENPVCETFLTEHTQSGARFALQGIRPELVADAGYKQSLLADVVQLIKMEHPNIVSPTNILEEQGRLYIVSDFIDGQNLEIMLQTQQGSLGIDGLIRIFKDVLRGFGYAHTEGVIHQLLSLRSIIVAPDGEAKLLGFGSSLPTAKERKLPEKVLLKYALYFAPERFSSPDLKDVRANIYSLGAMLFQMITSQPPYQAPTLFELELAHSQNPIPNPRSIRDDIPDGLAETIMKALSKNPSDRFQTTLEFYKDIEKIENMRRSELFHTDFTKGFGKIEGLSEENIVEASDSGSSFQLDDPFDASGMDLGFELPSEAPEAEDWSKKTVRDENFSADLFEQSPTGPNDSPPSGGDWEQAFDATLGDPKESEPASFGNFDFEPEAPSTDAPPADDPFAAQADPFGVPPDDPLGAATPDPFGAADPFGAPQADQADQVADPFGSPPVEKGPGGDDFGFDFGDGMDIDKPAQQGPDTGGGGFDFDTSSPDLGQPDAPGGPSFFSTDDGAFSFEPTQQPAEPAAEPEPQPEEAVEDEPPMPGIRRAREKMEDSFDAIDRDLARPIATVKVKRVDMKLIGLTALLGIILLGSGAIWFQKHKKTKHMEREISMVETLKGRHEFEQALSKIDQLLASSPSGEQERNLSNLQSQIMEEKEELKKQITTLMARAQELEATGKTFEDGRTDALGTYIRITELDPNNLQAQAAAHDIKVVQLGVIRELTESGKEVNALKILGTLVNVDPSDKKLSDRYKSMKSRLVKEKAGVLKTEINQLMGQQDYDAIPSRFVELIEIEPKSSFVDETKPLLLDTYTKLAEEARARLDFKNAAKYYEFAIQIDPTDNQTVKLLSEVNEENTRSRIERTQLLLDRATDQNNLKSRYQYATELNDLDPGNNYANSAIASANEALAKKLAQADSLRDLGQFKKAAILYREVYEIRGDEHAKILWKKYQRWAPPGGMAFVPGGRYRMGYQPITASRPSHFVTLSPFFVDATEVTNRQYKTFVDANPEWSKGRINPELHDGNYLKHWPNGAPPPGHEDRPVAFISWYAARAYAQFSGKRLLTEAEWEMAARGGSSDQKYWWGEHSDAKKAVYEFYPEKMPAKTGTFPANAYGIHEILGNVSEWVEDDFSLHFYDQSKDANDPLNAGSGEKVIRGGDYRSRGRDITVHKRFKRDPRTCESTLGFRCAKKAHIK